MKKILLLTFVISTLFSKANNSGFLGITINDFKSEKINGVLVNDVIENSAAQKFGIRENDIVTAVNNIAVLTKEELISNLSAFNAGDEVKISFIRNGSETTTKAVLGNKPQVINYLMNKTVKEDGEHWVFTNDNTEIVVKQDNTPVSVSQTDANGKVTTLQFAATNFNNIAQQFVDIEDKLISIKKNKIQQDKCSCKCPIRNFTYYKITPDVKPEVKNTVAAALIADKFTIAPNPSDGRFVVDFASKEKGTLQLSIIDITGRTVRAENVQNFDGFYNKEFTLTGEAKGAYFIQFQIAGKMTTKKIVLQ